MSQPIRILHVLQRMEPAGVQTLLMNIYRHIDRDKIQFDFLVHYTAPQFFDEEIQALGGRIYRFSVREDYNFIKYRMQLRHFFQTHPEYRIVHGHMHSLGMFYLGAAKKAGVPVRIAHSHTNSTQNDAKKYLKLFMNRHYAENATVLFACSEDAGRYMFGDRPFTVINNAIDADYFCFDEIKRNEKRKELGLENSFVLGSAGRFTLQKNQKYAVDVFEKVRETRSDAVLLLIGTGPMEAAVKEYVRSKGLEKDVMFLGNRRDMAGLYRAMDVFLFPSLFEGLGIVGVEAQASGTPVVCTDSLPKEINVTPLIYRLPLGNVSKWADTVLEGCRNPYRQSDMREYIARNEYDIKGLATRLEDFYLKTEHAET